MSSSSYRKIPGFLALACVLLAEKALPWDGHGSWQSDYSTSAAASNGTWSGRNPTEYTIGGVLSGSEGVERHFTQILSVSNRFICNSYDREERLVICTYFRGIFSCTCLAVLPGPGWVFPKDI